jgi:hypothetical protein
VLLALVGGVFVLGAVLKIQDPYAFLAAVYQYQIVGRNGGAVAAAVVPFIELFTGVLLLTRTLLRPAIMVALAMSLTFTTAQA